MASVFDGERMKCRDVIGGFLRVIYVPHQIAVPVDQGDENTFASLRFLSNDVMDDGPPFKNWQGREAKGFEDGRLSELCPAQNRVADFPVIHCALLGAAI